MSALPTKRPPTGSIATRPTGLYGPLPLPHRVQRRSTHGRSETVRHELGLHDLDGLDDVTIEHHGPTTRQVIDSILVPVAGGPNSEIAVTLASNIASSWDASITLLTVISDDADDETTRDASERLRGYADMVSDSPVTADLVCGDDIVSTITRKSGAHELIVIGGSERSLFQRFFQGSVPEQLARKTRAPMFVVSH